MMREQYLARNEHDGTMLDTYYKANVRNVVHSTVFDNTLQRCDASTYAFPLRHDLFQ